MSGFIDRDPEQMIRYAEDAMSLIGEMTLTIRKVEGVLDAYAADLDGPSQKKISDLHECCRDFFKHMEVYENIAQTIKSKGKRLSEVRGG